MAKNKGIKAPEARKLIGKVVEWDVNSLAFPKRQGTVSQVINRNICIGGEWYWMPDIKELRIIEEKLDNPTTN